MLILTHDHIDHAPTETRYPNNPYTVAEAETLLAARDAAIVPSEPEPFFIPFGRL